jgi:hypothetical protein
MMASLSIIVEGDNKKFVRQFLHNFIMNSNNEKTANHASDFWSVP